VLNFDVGSREEDEDEDKLETERKLILSSTADICSSLQNGAELVFTGDDHL